VGFKLAKELKVSPEEAARQFAEKIEHPLIEKVEVQGGYVNVFLKRTDVAVDVLEKAMEDNYGVREKTGERVVIDYSSINVAKPMHVGHLRSTIIGGSLRRIYRFRGVEAIGINYLGDIGTQFGKLIVAYKKWVDRESLEKEPIKELLRIYVKFHEEAEKNPELEEEAREAYRKLEEGEEEYVELWRKFRELTIAYAKKIYDLLGVEFDEYSGESFYVERARELAETLLKTGIAEKDPETGAIIVDFGNEQKDVILKSDGTTLYLSRDLAALLDRVERYDPKKLVYVVGSEQSDHFKKLFWLARKLGVNREMVHVPFGLINLPEGKMSTRKGRVVFLEDVLKKAINLAAEEMKKRGTYNEEDARKIGVGAVNYAILKIEPEKNITFQWEKVLSFEGDTGPYLQYSAVRARKILEKAGKWTLKKPEEVNDEEWALTKKIAVFPEVLEETLRKDRPHMLARYAYDLARTFHAFYDHNPVLQSEEPTRSFRLGIVKGFYNVLSTSLNLLLVDVPERM
ncbi:MAG: arginyl-tRNA synthetase, partial [Candidatus Diapherotrites archaeon]|nr:arginyl-tRNA synthetase [Candidatus Diapherotrites archaeon]